MSKSEGLSFSTGDEDHSVVDLTSNKYAGIIFFFCRINGSDFFTLRFIMKGTWLFILKFDLTKHFWVVIWYCLNCMHLVIVSICQVIFTCCCNINSRVTKLWKKLQDCV